MGDGLLLGDLTLGGRYQSAQASGARAFVESGLGLYVGDAKGKDMSFGLHAGVGIAVPLLRSKLDLEIALQGTRGLISDFTFRRVTQVM